jgi:4-carboxymuconolactone decarboxylase
VAQHNKNRQGEAELKNWRSSAAQCSRPSHRALAYFVPIKKDNPMTTSSKEIPEDLTRFRATYVELFGMLPPLPAARFEFSSEINPEFLRLSERLRAHAFYSDVFDIKTTHLILFGMLLVEHNAAAQMHALAARRAGATWQELHKVVELAAATKSLGPTNQGSSMLKSLRDKEQKS